jgi:hypothetical protein
MTNLLKSLFGQKDQKTAKTNDFSAFFGKPAGDKVKVIRQVLREANQEQRKVMEAYQKVPASQ